MTSRSEIVDGNTRIKVGSPGAAPAHGRTSPVTRKTARRIRHEDGDSGRHRPKPATASVTDDGPGWSWCSPANRYRRPNRRRCRRRSDRWHETGTRQHHDSASRHPQTRPGPRRRRPVASRRRQDRRSVIVDTVFLRDRQSYTPSNSSKRRSFGARAPGRSTAGPRVGLSQDRTPCIPNDRREPRPRSANAATRPSRPRRRPGRPAGDGSSGRVDATVESAIGGYPRTRLRAAH